MNKLGSALDGRPCDGIPLRGAGLLRFCRRTGREDTNAGRLAQLDRKFVDNYYEEEAFVKRRRDKTRVDRVDDGIGDARIRQASDVYRAPRRKEVSS